jgi:hypothetical protein
MSCLLTAVLTASLPLAPAWAQDPPQDPAPARLEALRKEVDEALAGYMSALRDYKEGDPEDKIEAAWDEAVDQLTNAESRNPLTEPEASTRAPPSLTLRALSRHTWILY